MRAAKDKENVTVEKAAEGVWFLAGGSHNSAAIEMKDYVILVEAPLYDGRAPVMIDACTSSPGKPVRYVVNTHNHFDHSGGLRAAVAEGAALIAQAQSRRLVREGVRQSQPHRPDALAKSGRKLKVVPVNEKLVDDGARKVEVYRPPERSRRHAARHGVPAGGKAADPGRRVHAGSAQARRRRRRQQHNQLTLVDAIERLKLQVERHLPLHGRIVPNAELYRAEDSSSRIRRVISRRKFLRATAQLRPPPPRPAVAARGVVPGGEEGEAAAGNPRQRPALAAQLDARLPHRGADELMPCARSSPRRAEKRPRCASRAHTPRHGRPAILRRRLMLDTRKLNRVLAFDGERGLREVESGVQWPEILAFFRPPR